MEQLDARIGIESKYIRKAALLACRANIVVGGSQKNLVSQPGWREECGRGRSRPGDERTRVQQGRNQSSGLGTDGGGVEERRRTFSPKATRGRVRLSCRERGQVFFLSFVSLKVTRVFVSFNAA